MSTPAMNLAHADVPANGASRGDLFALSDEQILEIEPDAPNSTVAAEPVVAAAEPVEVIAAQTSATLSEPPRWLADMMADPQAGAEARDLWNGVQTARQDAAAYREVFAKPEQARAAAERARALEEIDAAFFGGAGKSAQDISAGRVALADRMLREDPAAFREMVFAGLRALESAGQNTSAAASQEHVGAVVRPREVSKQAAVATDTAETPSSEQGGYRVDSSAVAAYRTFEKSANEELERSVGGAIQHSLKQALPNLGSRDGATTVGARYIVPLQERLAAAVRDDVESALKSDQQLGEQLGRVLATRRFDETTRAQVVRLINDRAQQLVPVAARRVIQEWTQTAFASRSGRSINVAPGFSPALGEDAVLARNNASAATPPSLANSFGSSAPSGHAGTVDTSRSASRASASQTSAKAAAGNRAERDAGLAPRATARPNGRAVDYHRLTDEQILDM